MQYTFDTHFFDEINTQEKAYVLGFLFADGYNYEKRGVVSLSLQEKDKEILDKISKSGYESLSSKEKEFLFKMSKKE